MDDQEVKVTCLVMEEWLPVANPTAQQTYQQFGFAGGFLCQNRVAETASIIEDNDVVCHVAKTFLGRWNSQIFHALPLNKVREWCRTGLGRYLSDSQMLDSYTIPLERDFHS